MKILGKVIKVCQKIEGQSDNGKFWEKQDLVLAVGDKGSKVVISFFGERRMAMLKPLQPGDLVEVNISVKNIAVLRSPNGMLKPLQPGDPVEVHCEAVEEGSNDKEQKFIVSFKKINKS